MKYLSLALFFALALSAHAEGGEIRAVEKYNLEQGVGLKGYDPVAVFPEGGGQARAGEARYRIDYEGVTYFFASAENQQTFLTNPRKYEPTYGGWCAYAMASGLQVNIQPQLFTLNGNRAHYFVSARAKQNFDRTLEDHENRADGFWMQISGESPRL